ncbi:hypothetical protein AAG570_007115 [Ranatra chinensis]|uniref:Uncharacterized protein n=1 Tax=Ranatra chinensis TaxID=642074 RepID=A0ABD0YDH6_9HEMI
MNLCPRWVRWFELLITGPTSETISKEILQRFPLFSKLGVQLLVSTRIQEHIRTTKNNDMKSALTEHSMETSHLIDFEKSTKIGLRVVRFGRTDNGNTLLSADYRGADGVVACMYDYHAITLGFESLKESLDIEEIYCGSVGSAKEDDDWETSSHGQKTGYAEDDPLDIKVEARLSGDGKGGGDADSCEFCAFETSWRHCRLCDFLRGSDTCEFCRRRESAEWGGGTQRGGLKKSDGCEFCDRAAAERPSTIRPRAKRRRLD